MIYTEMTQKAMKIAYEAHLGQYDKGGVPYIFHPTHLAEQMETEATATAALLHDVVEDTPLTIEDLRRAGISEEVLTAVELLTHKKDTDYFEYVRAIKKNPVARAVKIADLRHNTDPTRLCDDEHIRFKTERYYYPALRYLLEEEDV
ncbi:MAG: HD domain-containing protein [Clostridia bacterium]|nr:HD domain-containing protein [Clostridia bacterium]